MQKYNISHFFQKKIGNVNSATQFRNNVKPVASGRRKRIHFSKYWENYPSEDNDEREED
jgi:hypothetical protein